MILVIRIRGRLNITKPIKDTMKMLRIERSHNAVILPDTPIFKGMIKKVKDYVMYGSIDEKVLTELLSKRLERKDKKPVDEKLITKVVKTLKSGKLLKDEKEVIPFLRLHPPVKGFIRGGIKKTIKQGGNLGHNEKIGDFVKRMM